MNILIFFIVSLLLTLFGLLGPFSDKIRQVVVYVGGFSLVGLLVNGVTLYGFSVWIIFKRFNKGKKALKAYLMTEFFSKEQVEKMLGSQESGGEYPLTYLGQYVDYDQLYEATLEILLNSRLGDWLKLGRTELGFDPLKEQFKQKISAIFLEYNRSLTSLNKRELAQLLVSKIEREVDSHLGNLTPSYFKKILRQVVLPYVTAIVCWAGVVGSVIGGAVSILFNPNVF